MRQAVVAVQTRIWAELSAAQQAHVGGVIEAWRAKAAEQQMGQMRERYRREIGARFDEMQTDRPAPSDRRPEQDAEGRGGDTSELRQWFASLPDDVQRQVHERLLSMPAERRDALIQRATQMSAQERAQLVRRLLQAGQSPTERPKPQ
jgi:hypothetical protein